MKGIKGKAGSGGPEWMLSFLHGRERDLEIILFNQLIRKISFKMVMVSDCYVFIAKYVLVFQ